MATPSTLPPEPVSARSGLSLAQVGVAGALLSSGSSSQAIRKRSAPDGVAFGESGLLYVAMATPLASGVSILFPTGSEKLRLGNPAGSPVNPFDSPANIAFNNKAGSILLTNHAFVTGVVDPGQFSVLDVYVVADKASPLASQSFHDPPSVEFR